ncbi:MAG: hypothetical protein JWP35_197 [Caulobacter sp.]|nr:hypothetical protein [Caulobacter sp.]
MLRQALAGGLFAAGVALAAVAQTAPPLKELRWLAAGADPVTEAATRPVECLAPGEHSLPVEIGRAAFRSPLLLGGQASRAGLSCEACHRNGRTNAQFSFPGVSGAPGTADVTNSLFSSHRGDGVDNPRPIPDLGGPKTALKISQNPASPGLRDFIHGLVTQEFDGDEPAPAVMDGLAAYVRALSPANCPATARQPLRAADLTEDARRAVRAARGALALKDPATAIAMLDAARAPLFRLDERYAGPDLAADRNAIRAASLELGAVLADLRAGARHVDQRLSVWLGQSSAWGAALVRDEPRSLFNPTNLKAALAPPR